MCIRDRDVFIIIGFPVQLLDTVYCNGCLGQNKQVKIPQNIRLLQFLHDVVEYGHLGFRQVQRRHQFVILPAELIFNFCLLYTSDAADDLLCVDLGGRRIIKKNKKKTKNNDWPLTDNHSTKAYVTASVHD